ncbi:site-2 protease family protein [Fictibacillus enclensis]|uniref:site-2 protease family protein n=1 Tax=Fictibacillus enclensis TaxID=1017270 RepID=UPI0025A0A561|nr:site-2 protease family protein [Fictibacillus enclensis]MDM5200685.1 site-2 protease family protein [Fictibacillus enclensis]
MAERAEKKNQSRIWTVLAGMGLFILGKLKWVFGLLKLGKFATLASMFVSVGAYAMFFGWKFAVALVYLLFVHEMGHLVAMKRKGIPTSPAIFVPFMGAVIGMKEMPKNAKDEAFVAYAGPLFGLLSFLPAVYLYETQGSPFWGLVVFLGAFINLFNLFPVSPLDGGRIVGVLSTKLWLIGLICMIPYMFISPDPIIFLIFLFGIATWWRRVREDYVLQESKQSLELHQKEEEKIHELVREMEEYRDLPNFPYIVDTFIDEGRVEKERLIRNLPSGFTWPFVHDKKRLKKDAMLTEINLLQKREKYFLFLYKHEVMKEKEKERLLAEQEFHTGEDMGADPEGGRPEKVVEAYLIAVKEEAQTQQEEVDRRKNYYVASLKTKIVVLLLYLALAGVLSYFAMYGHTIMEVHRELLQR